MVGIVKQAIRRLRTAGYTGEFFIYCLLHGNIQECVERIIDLRRYDKKLYIQAQPYIDYVGTKPPQWPKDLEHYCNQRMIYAKVELKDFMPRKNFRYMQYL